ncbi:unnamed protein product [Linum trigynum]|uniref:Uncharacterized protein n=1 Tax=Linum trigynum TaxID=586398 RepID=A0AAV2FR66_9ROSI
MASHRREGRWDHDERALAMEGGAIEHLTLEKVDMFIGLYTAGNLVQYCLVLLETGLYNSDRDRTGTG